MYPSFFRCTMTRQRGSSAKDLSKRCCRALSSSTSKEGGGGGDVPPAGNPQARARPPSGNGGRKVTVLDLQHKKRSGRRISMVTAYDYPSALHVDLAGIDMILCGDSVAMVELGYPTTQPVDMEQMLHHCKAVARGSKRSLVIGDMPFGSYEVSEEAALTNAFRFIKEGFTDAVKIEGGRDRAKTVQKIVKGGIAVMGHVGLTPQAISVLGGFRAQGRTAYKARSLVVDALALQDARAFAVIECVPAPMARAITEALEIPTARSLVDDALALQDAGAFAVVIECVPAPVAKAITEALEIPTIGIGAGPHTCGQVLVYHDMLGMTSHPHHEQFVPRFCKRYAQLGEAIRGGLEAFKKDVEEGTFPSEEFSPYKMPKDEEEAFKALMERDSAVRRAKAEEAAQRLKANDEYETIKLY